MANPGSDSEKETKLGQEAKGQQAGPVESRQDTGRQAGSRDETEGRGQRFVGGAERMGSGMVGGVAHVATDLVGGVGTVGAEVVNVVRDTANVAIAGVGSVGETAVHTVTHLLSDLVAGVRDIGSAAVRRRGTGEEKMGEGTGAQRHEEVAHQ